VAILLCCSEIFAACVDTKAIQMFWA